MSGLPAPRRDSARFVEMTTALLTEGRAVRFRANGWSMHPAIKDGEAIVVEPVPVAGIRIGDVLLHRSARGVTAHRLVAIDTASSPRRLVLKGDAAPEPDDPIADADVFGRVVVVEAAVRPRIKVLASKARGAFQRLRRP